MALIFLIVVLLGIYSILAARVSVCWRLSLAGTAARCYGVSLLLLSIPLISFLSAILLALLPPDLLADNFAFPIALVFTYTVLIFTALAFRELEQEPSPSRLKKAVFVISPALLLTLIAVMVLGGFFIRSVLWAFS